MKKYVLNSWISFYTSDAYRLHQKLLKQVFIQILEGLHTERNPIRPAD